MVGSKNLVVIKLVNILRFSLILWAVGIILAGCDPKDISKDVEDVSDDGIRKDPDQLNVTRKITKNLIAHRYSGPTEGGSGSYPINYADKSSLPQARYNGIKGMAIHNKNMYISDSANFYIKRIDMSANQVSLFAGSGSGGVLFNIEDGDSLTPANQLNLGGLGAITLKDEYLYFTINQSQLAKIRLDGDSIAQKEILIAGTDLSQSEDGVIFDSIPDSYGLLKVDEIKLKNPKAIAVSGSYIYIADSGNKTVRKISIEVNNMEQRMVMNIVGPVNRDFAAPSGLAFVGDDLYISDIEKHSLYTLPKADLASANEAGVIIADYFSVSKPQGDQLEDIKDVSVSSPSEIVTNGVYLYVLRKEIPGSIMVINKQNQISVLNLIDQKSSAVLLNKSLQNPVAFVYDSLNGDFYVSENSMHRIIKLVEE